jgi:hypothetical protein
VNPFLLPAFQKCFARAPSPLHTGNTPKQSKWLLTQRWWKFLFKLNLNLILTSNPMSQASATQVTEGWKTINHIVNVIFFFISSNLLKNHQIRLKKCQQDVIYASMF